MHNGDSLFKKKVPNSRLALRSEKQTANEKQVIYLATAIRTAVCMQHS